MLCIGVEILKRIPIYTLGVYVSSSPSQSEVGSLSTLNKTTDEFWQFLRLNQKKLPSNASPNGMHNAILLNYKEIKQWLQADH